MARSESRQVIATREPEGVADGEDAEEDSAESAENAPADGVEDAGIADA